MDIRGVTALVTGGAHRVGKGIVLGLASAGCNIVLHYHSSAEKAEETASEVRGMGVEVGLVSGDLSTDARGVMARVGDLAPVQILVNSAGIFPEDTIRSATVDTWDETMAVNLRAPAFLTQAFAEALPEGMRGAVVNVTDWRTARPYGNHFSYIVAKAGLDGLTVAAAEALAPDIRVNAVALGAILPPAGRSSEYLQELAQEIPVEHVGGVTPVAEAVVFLVQSDFITGEIIRIDGGAHLR